MTTGERLKELREFKGIERSECASLLGMPYTTYVNYETDQRKLTGKNLLRIADFFSVSTDYLLDRQDSFNPKNTKGVFLQPYQNVPGSEILTNQVPIIGVIAAGVPIDAIQDIEGHLTVPANWFVDFALRVKGDSMIGAGIPNGSIVLCRSQQDVDDGQIAVCIVNGYEATLKRVRRFDDYLVLHPENPTMEDIRFKGSDRATVKIMGLAVKILKDVQ